MLTSDTNLHIKGIPSIEATKAVASVEKLTSRFEHHHRHFLESGLYLISPKVKVIKVCKLHVPSLKFDVKFQTISRSTVSWYSR